MRRGSPGLASIMVVGGALLLAGQLAPVSLAQTPPDRSEVVLVLDFSASILVDVANRDRFAAAVDRIADRVDATSSDLVAGDATVSIVQFATRAIDVAGCVNLRLLNSPTTVAAFANCLRNIATAYRKGIDPALTQTIGIDTNYVAAMEKAARHLGAEAVRPALILFTDGKHDVAGVPVSQVVPTARRLFGSRSPFALLPVGMGLVGSERAALESGLLKLRTIRNMPACVSGARFEWPRVVFQSADDAGNAVAVALQDVTCTFTVAPAPTPAPTPVPTPVPTPDAVRGITLTPGDGRIQVAWIAPASMPAPIVDYLVRCRAGDGAWTESQEGRSVDATAVVDGLTNGAAYECDVAAVDATTQGAWTAASSTATPFGRPAAPAKPTIQALDHAVRIQVPANGPSSVSSYRYECSGDEGRTWPAGIQAPSVGISSVDVVNLANTVEYVCRAFASNDAGVSEPSAVSNAVRPCGSLLECNPVISPVLGILGGLAAAGILLAGLLLYRGRARGYVVAVVDVVHSANLGRGSKLGIGFVRTQPRGPVTGVVADRTARADLRIRVLGGDRFEVTDRNGRQVALGGKPVIAIDPLGAAHSIVLRRFAPGTASVESGPN